MRCSRSKARRMKLIAVCESCPTNASNTSPLTAPSMTNGAVKPEVRNPARKVVVFVNVGEEVRRVAERKCGTVIRLKPAEWRVSIPLLSFACRSPSFQTVL